MDKKVSPRSVSTTPTFVFNPTPVPPKQNAVHKTQTPQASTHKRESTTPTAVSKDNFKTMLHRCAFRHRRRAIATRFPSRSALLKRVWHCSRLIGQVVN